VQATTHEFGTVKQGERIEHVFTIRNDGTASLTIQLAGMSVPGMNAKFRPDVAAGAEGTFRLSCDTTHLKGPIEATAGVRLNDPKLQEIRFVLKSVVQPPIEFQPFAALFLSAFRGEAVQSSVRVLNHEDRALNITGLEANSQRFTAAVKTVEPGKTYELRVTTRGDAPFGRAQEPIYLLTDNPERSRVRGSDGGHLQRQWQRHRLLVPLRRLGWLGLRQLLGLGETLSLPLLLGR
jgi:hypothetical protein